MAKVSSAHGRYSVWPVGRGREKIEEHTRDVDVERDGPLT